MSTIESVIKPTLSLFRKPDFRPLVSPAFCETVTYSGEMAYWGYENYILTGALTRRAANFCISLHTLYPFPPSVMVRYFLRAHTKASIKRGITSFFCISFSSFASVLIFFLSLLRFGLLFRGSFFPNASLRVAACVKNTEIPQPAILYRSGF